MELIYTWIEGEKILSNFEINMGWRERFTYDAERNILIGEEDPDYIKDFFSRGVSNITAFVGSNGSGKSTALEFFINVLPKGQVNDPKAILIHFSEEWQKLIIYAHESIASKIQVQTSSVYEIVNTLRNQYDYQDLIYYTNSFYDRVIERNLLGLHNASLSNLLFSTSSVRSINMNSQRTGDDFTLRFKFSEYARILAFLYSNINKNIDIILPNYLMVSTIFKPEIDSDSHFINYKNAQNFKDIYGKIVKIYDGKIDTSKTLKSKFLLIVERNIVLDELTLHNLLEIKSDLIESLLNNPIEIANILHGNSKKPDQINDFINYLEKLIGENDIALDTSVAWIDISKTSPASISRLLAHLRRLSNYDSNFIQLGLSHQKMLFGESSSGELALLSMLSRLFALSNSQQRMANLKLDNNVLILMDEPELYLHPIYQKNVINYLTELLPQIFNKINVQIILTSHSPFIISDLPKRNVCFFTGNRRFVTSELMDHKQTFASNIHTLLSDSFFLDNGFIGSFAKKKLDSVIKDLNTTKDISVERKGEIRKIIVSIGEPILKRKLLEMYNDKFNKDLEYRVTNLENKLGI
ncbi:AAA family ATPase [Sphingobacterium multivorum]|uniref:AAA family ATPase n=1 Tax=Sphingobacterium multivorum TaxID=28454 RepID=UPI0028A65F3D|nr:AAA family ATPase [Sphingobacterium multivorum]